MSQESLSVLIRTAFEAALRPEVAAALDSSELELGGIPIVELPARVRAGASTYAEQDQLWVLALEHYRRGPRQLWAPVILEMLAPALLQTVVLLGPLAPVVDEEDISQQLLGDALETAATLPISEGRRYMERRLILRTLNRTLRWMWKQYRVSEAGRLLSEPSLEGFIEQVWLNKEAIPHYALPRKRAQRREERPAGAPRGSK
jgi:hypothetical protein